MFEYHSNMPKRLTNAVSGWLQAFPLYSSLGMSALVYNSLIQIRNHVYSTDIHADIEKLTDLSHAHVHRVCKVSKYSFRCTCKLYLWHSGDDVGVLGRVIFRVSTINLHLPSLQYVDLLHTHIHSMYMYNVIWLMLTHNVCVQHVTTCFKL